MSGGAVGSVPLAATVMQIAIGEKATSDPEWEFGRTNTSKDHGREEERFYAVAAIPESMKDLTTA